MATENEGSVAYPIKRTFRSSIRYGQRRTTCHVLGLTRGIRLNYNHLIMKEVTGHSLHPKIPVGEGSLRIADVGAGTGYGQAEVAHFSPRH